jgi:uncharacterized protein YjdB
MAHLQGRGDTDWVTGNTFVGTRGQNRPLEGFAIKLIGDRASNLSVKYTAHVEGIGDMRTFSDGEFCGTRGQARRVEGILVRIEHR